MHQLRHAAIIIPTYNERENIAKVIPMLLEVFDDIKNWKMSIVVVDDTSPDETYEVVRELAKKHTNVHLVLNKTKAGLGAAYLKGMDYSFSELKVDAVFEFDADLSHDAIKIPIFLKKLDEGYDMVLGSRYIPGGSIPENWGFHRKFMSLVGNIIIMTVFTHFKIRDWTGGFRAFTKEVYDAVDPEMHSERFTGYTFQIGFLHKTVRKGFKIIEVPFHFIDRTIGQSKLGPEYIKNNLIYIFKVRIQEVMAMRIFKFVIVGGMGALTQLLTLQLYRQFLPYQIAFFVAIETAVLSNFILSNLWTFSDRKLTISQFPLKFLTFNLASGGSILIQQIIAFGGEKFIGLRDVFMLPIIGMMIDTGLLFAVAGILIGMFWNFFAYNAFVWKKKKAAT